MEDLAPCRCPNAPLARPHQRPIWYFPPFGGALLPPLGLRLHRVGKLSTYFCSLYKFISLPAAVAQIRFWIYVLIPRLDFISLDVLCFSSAVKVCKTFCQVKISPRKKNYRQTRQGMWRYYVRQYVLLLLISTTQPWTYCDTLKVRLPICTANFLAYAVGVVHHY
jgi:hypothetical protein